MILGNRGQLSIEYLFLFVIMIMLVLISSEIILEETELNNALNCAETGAYEGALIDSISIYSIKEYNSLYGNKHLFYPKEIRIINITYTRHGYNSEFNKKDIHIQVTASSNINLTNNEKLKLSQIINNRIRRSIVYGFHNEDKTNVPYYTVCYSDRYFYKTEDVIWI